MYSNCYGNVYAIPLSLFAISTILPFATLSLVFAAYFFTSALMTPTYINIFFASLSASFTFSIFFYCAAPIYICLSISSICCLLFPQYSHSVFITTIISYFNISIYISRFYTIFSYSLFVVVYYYYNSS
jgi:hypothetical protein